MKILPLHVSAVVAALVLAACSESAVAPAVRDFSGPMRAPLAATIGTPSTVRRDLEGQVWVCKTANAAAPQETFNFTYSATKPLGSSQPDLLPGSFSIKNGECALIYAIDREVTVGRYSVTVTEGAMPNANWAFNSVSAATISPFSAAAFGNPVANGQTISDVGFIHDQGVIVTFSNTYTAPSGQIGDFVWDDLNANGIQDSGEPGLAGVKVNLSGAATATTTTNASGFYSFAGLSAGSYTVTVDPTTLPAGYTGTLTGQGTTATDNNGASASVTLATSSSVDLTIDFGYLKPAGQIGDFVWNDLNGNGVQDSGEPGLAGVKVNLTGAATASATTDASGFYSFGSLRAGSYTVTVDGTTLPTGFVATLTGQGTSATDSNGSPVSVSLAANNAVDLTIDFGFRALSGPKCTLTQGYWKTHQEDWDVRGERIVWNGQTFFNTGKTYAFIYTLSAAGGNSFVQLAHQYIAAKLNLNGGSDPTINSAIAQAESLLSGHTAGSTFIKNATWTALASTLDDYNTGKTGPGHCN